MMNRIDSKAVANFKVHFVPASDRPRLLCATDLSVRSEHAMQRAFLIAEQLDAHLLLLHVVDERQEPMRIGMMADRARSTLQWQANRLAPGNHVADFSVRVGKPHGLIAAVAREWRADLVILGSYRSYAGERLLGTTAERVVRAAGRPVLIVNGSVPAPYSNVLLASDLSDEFTSVARMTRHLGLLENAEVSIVHALQPASRSILYTAGVDEQRVTHYLEGFKQSARVALTSQLQAAGLDPARLRIVQEYAPPSRVIEMAVAGMTPQLLVMGMSRFARIKRLLTGSVANDVLRKISCDLLIASPTAAKRLRSKIDSSCLPHEAAAAAATREKLNVTRATI